MPASLSRAAVFRARSLHVRAKRMLIVRQTYFGSLSNLMLRPYGRASGKGLCCEVFDARHRGALHRSRESSCSSSMRQTAPCIVLCPLPAIAGYDAQFVIRFIRWLGLHDYLVLAAIAFIAVGTYGFVKLLSEVREGDTMRSMNTLWSRSADIGGRRSWKKSGETLRRWVASSCSRWL